MIIVRNYFQNSIPHDLVEAAEIDGASEFCTFISVVIPLSVPILAVQAVFSMVAYWNDWLTAMIVAAPPMLIAYPLVSTPPVGTAYIIRFP